VKKYKSQFYISEIPACVYVVDCCVLDQGYTTFIGARKLSRT